MEGPNVTECPRTISIIGTGDFARAMAMRLHDSKFEVVVGSRLPEKRKEVPPGDIFTKVKVTSIPSCIQASDVIIVALHAEHHAMLKPLETSLRGKILVDCSNSVKASDESNAQKLSTLLPDSFVIKAFNTVSAFVLLMTFEQRVVYVCGDSEAARAVILQMASRMNFSPVDSGPLSASLEFEEINRKLMPGWGLPTLVSIIVFLLWTVYTICRHYVMGDYTWERFPMDVVLKITGVTSYTLLALSHIPGSIAAFKQLASGTKHKRFGPGLDNWLKMRKQLGLYALLLGTFHMVQCVSLLGPAYFKRWYETARVTIPGNLTEDYRIPIDSRMNWKGETCALLGFLALFTMGIMGLTSINSIGNVLNWREWRFFQSHLSLVVLLFTVAHVTVMAAPNWASDRFTWQDILKDLSFISSLLPWFATVMRLVLLLPCFYTRINKIRRGWERGNEDISVVIRGDPGSRRESVEVNGGKRGSVDYDYSDNHKRGSIDSNNNNKQGLVELNGTKIQSATNEAFTNF